MKVLCVNQFFWPDVAPTSQLLTDVVRRLAVGGHEVTVICGASVYSHKDQSQPLPNRVQIIRIPGFSFSRGFAVRAASYALFFWAAIWRALTLDRPDIVLTMTTPPFISFLGTAIKKIRGSRHFIWEMDLYPEVAVDVGIISPNSLSAKLLTICAKAQRSRADGIIGLGECMRTRLIACGLDSKRIQIAHNWADGTIFFPRPPGPMTNISCIYPGNFGLGHDSATLITSLSRIDPDERIRIRFVGGGVRYEELKILCQSNNYRSIEFKPYCTPMELASIEFPQANVGIVLQDERCSGSIVPSKVYSLLASGLPILFIGPRSATPARIIELFQCGWHVQTGHSGELIALLNRLASRPDEVQAASHRARQAFLENFDRPIGTARILTLLGIEEKQTSAVA